jgi:hypothetical protein
MQKDEEDYETAVETSRSQGMAPTGFTFFSKLPPELRLKIWELAIPEDFIIRICYEQTRGPPSLNQDTPAMISVSHEARSVALKVYTVISIPSAKQRFYFSADRDILGFDGEFSLYSFTIVHPLELAAITGEVRHIMPAEESSKYWAGPIRDASEFRVLENFICVVRDYQSLNKGEIDDLRAKMERIFRHYQREPSLSKNIPTIIIRDWEEIRW